MNIVEIEAKKSVLQSTKQAAMDKANITLAPIRMQIGQLESQAHAVTLRAVEQIANIDGQLAVLDDLARELTPPPARPAIKAVPPIEDAPDGSTTPATVNS